MLVNGKNALISSGLGPVFGRIKWWGGFFFSIIAIKSGNFLVCLDLKVSSSNSCHVWMELHGHKEIENDCPAHGLLSIFFCLGHLHSNLWFQSLRPL